MEESQLIDIQMFGLPVDGDPRKIVKIDWPPEVGEAVCFEQQWQKLPDGTTRAWYTREQLADALGIIGYLQALARLKAAKK